MLTTDADRVAAELADRYTIEDVLGHGSSAAVFLALDRRHQRRVALKVLSAAVGKPWGRNASSARSSLSPGCSILTSCPCSIPATPPAGSGTACRMSRPAPSATGSRAAAG
jgi:hypothetical protein